MAWVGYSHQSEFDLGMTAGIGGAGPGAKQQHSSLSQGTPAAQGFAG